MSSFVELPILDLRDQTPSAYTLYLAKPEGNAFDYAPGQYLTVKITHEGEEYRRAYSLSSSPYLDEQLAITVKREKGGRVSHLLRDAYQPGDTLACMPARGSFRVELRAERPRHYLLIAGGSGITPLMSILRSVLAAEPESEVSLWYGSRNRTEIIFREELSELAQQFPERLHVLHSLSQPEADWPGYRGRLDRERIYDLVSEVFMTSELPKVYFLCGPQGLMEAAEAALDKHAVNFNDVHRENFHVPLEALAESEAQAPTKEPASSRPPLEDRPVVIHLHGERSALTVQASESILDAAIQADLDPPFACQGGICTSCQARLITGEVYMDRNDALTQEEIDQGYILTCQSHPLTDEVELEYGDEGM